jgi:hypothetical protein
LLAAVHVRPAWYPDVQEGAAVTDPANLDAAREMHQELRALGLLLPEFRARVAMAFRPLEQWRTPTGWATRLLPQPERPVVEMLRELAHRLEEAALPVAAALFREAADSHSPDDSMVAFDKVEKEVAREESRIFQIIAATASEWAAGATTSVLPAGPSRKASTPTSSQPDVPGEGLVGPVELQAFRETLETAMGEPRENGRVAVRALRGKRVVFDDYVARAAYEDLDVLSRGHLVLPLTERARGRARRLQQLLPRLGLSVTESQTDDSRVLKPVVRFTMQLVDGHRDRKKAARRLAREADRRSRGQRAE